MKFLLLLGFVIISVKGQGIKTGLTTTAGTELHKKTIGPIEDNGSEASRRRVAEFAEKYGAALTVNEEEVTNEANFVRPCAFENKECIRQFLAKNSHCKPVRDRIDPLHLSQNTGFLSYTNVTLTFTDNTVTGLDDAKIIEFYYNEKTCKVVLAIEIPCLNETTPEACFTYHRTAKESVTLCDTETALFRDIIFTAIIPTLPKLRLDLAEIHPYLKEANPTFIIGPKATTSDDPQLNIAFAELTKSVPISVREYMLLQCQLFMAVYIQNHLCDFGVDLYSV